MKTRIVSNNNNKTAHIKTVSFQTVSFFDPKQERQVIVLYSLGEDGIVREFNNKGWVAFPIEAQE